MALEELERKIAECVTESEARNKELREAAELAKAMADHDRRMANYE